MVRLAYEHIWCVAPSVASQRLAAPLDKRDQLYGLLIDAWGWLANFPEDQSEWQVGRASSGRLRGTGSDHTHSHRGQYDSKESGSHTLTQGTE